MWQEHNAEGPGQELTSVRFAQIARQLNTVAKEHGLRTPAFRSPPRTPGLRRSIKRRSDGSATVSVSLRGRPAVAVVADMIDGVVAANEPGSTRSAEIIDRLWSAATPLLSFQPESAVSGFSARPASRAA
jgi:hypothetical protein